MTFRVRVNSGEFFSPKSSITGKEILELASLLPVEQYELLKKTNHKGFEPIQLTEDVDLTEPGIESFSAKLYNELVISINDKNYSVEEVYSSPNKLLELSGFNPQEHYLIQIKNGDIEIGYKEENDANHKIHLKTGLKFYVYSRPKLDVVIKIDDVDFTLSKGIYTGAQLKKIGGVKLGYELEQVKNGIITIEDTTKVDICGNEIFISHPRDGQSS